jgi:thiamine biosynthesis lipoprotein
VDRAFPVLAAAAALLAAGCGRARERKTTFGRREDSGRLVFSAERAVMGGVTARVQVSLPRGSSGEDARPALLRALDRIDVAESFLSSFRASSDVTRLARAPRGEWVSVDADTLMVLRLSKSLSEATGGAFDVTVGPLVHAYGFHTEGPPSFPSEEEIERARSRVGSGLIELDVPGSRARLLAEGMEIDTGAVGKGYAVTVAAGELSRMGVRRALVEIGGEVEAVGLKGPAVPWTIGVEDPRAGGAERLPAAPAVAAQAGSRLAKIELPQGKLRACATSADTYQHFVHQGRRYSHIIDPRTGRPRTGGVVSATVLALDCATADGMATALCIMPADEGLALVERWRDMEAMLVVENEDGSVETRLSSGFPVENREGAGDR